jgi:histidinol-phosphate aminotransferase
MFHGREIKMKKLTRKTIEELKPYVPGKPIEELERELGIKDSIKLASNENPLGPSPFAIKAIVENAVKINRYPDGRGYQLKSKISKEFGLKEENIILGNGSNELIELAFRTFLLPDEEIIQPFPTFLVYEKIAKTTGARVTSVPLKEFRCDLEAMEEKINPRTKIIIINNPNNPTGTAINRYEMMEFLKSIPEDVIILIDEAYIEFATGNEIAKSNELLSLHPLIFAIRTFSKLYGLAGLRIGYGFGSKKLIDYMNRVRQPFNTNMLAQIGAAAALDDKDFVRKTLNLVKDGLDYLYRELERLGLEYIPTMTNFVLIKTPLGARITFEKMLKKGVIIRSMESFGLKDHIRVNVGLPHENKKFIQALEEILS